MDQRPTRGAEITEMLLSWSELKVRDSTQNPAFVHLVVLMGIRISRGSLRKPRRCPVLTPDWLGRDLPRRAQTCLIPGGSGVHLRVH